MLPASDSVALNRITKALEDIARELKMIRQIMEKRVKL